MKYVFHPTALTEYGEAVKFYAERRVELAQAFINTINALTILLGFSCLCYLLLRWRWTV